MRLLIVEDDTLTRLTLETTVRAHGINDVVGASTAADAIARQTELRPSAAIIDLDLGVGPTGVDVAAALRRHNPDIGIVLLTSYEDPRLLTSPGQQLPAGCQYLLKKNIDTMDQILEALEKSLTSKKVTRVAELSPSPFGRLTNSQIETLRFVAEGHSNAHIAATMGVNEKAVEQQITRIAARLGVKREEGKNTRVGIARAYFRLRGASDGTE